MTLETGRVIGDYEVICQLGHGGMGRVYRVKNLISNREEAMKVLLPDLSNEDEMDLAGRFLKEIRLVAGLQHPNIATLHTAMRHENQILMLMELVEGCNLEERLRQGPVSLSEGAGYCSQVLTALAYAHGKGVIHCDIKPTNVMLEAKTGLVKLLDFGIAQSWEDQAFSPPEAILGSLFYMSPEQVSGEAPSERSDVYSTGVMLYRIVTGKKPFSGGSQLEVMQAQMHELPTPPREMNGEVPLALSEIIMHALAKDPEARFPSARAFQKALTPFTGNGYSSKTAAAGADDPTVVSAPKTAASAPAIAPMAAPATTSRAIEKILAKFVGPIAATLVKKYSRTTTSAQQLCSALAQELADDKKRDEFLKLCGREIGVDPSGVRGTAVAGRTVENKPSAWTASPELLDWSSQQLAKYIGPIAKITTREAARNAHSVEAFFALLAAEIKSPEDRQKFLASRRTAL